MDERVMTLYIDFDGLKSINDEHGHATGDQALRLMADALRASTRTSDIVARLGGDEFLVASFAGGHLEVERLAERILEAVGARSVDTLSGPIPLQCSIGMAMSDADVTTVDALIHRADAALYEAKRRGRDRAVWADEGGMRSAAATPA
jgi:diguanylate cyclase (GGDEF)-like protein